MKLYSTVLNLLLLSFFTLSFNVQLFAQSNSTSPEQVCTKLLDLISVKQGEQVDWETLEILFHPAAQIHLQNPQNQQWIQWSIEDFKQNTAYSKIGFQEKALQRTVSTSNKIAQVVEYYEATVESTNQLLHGHNYYTLVLTNSGWKIMDLMWEEINSSVQNE